MERLDYNFFDGVNCANKNVYVLNNIVFTIYIDKYKQIYNVF